MDRHVALAAAATIVALAFAAATFERWLDTRARHHAAWSAALVLFAAGALAMWFGAGVGWEPASFRAFYLFGAVLNVPALAVGTVYLLAGRRTGDRVALAVAAAGAFSVGVMVSAPLVAPIDPADLPQGSEVFGALPRVLAAVASSGGAIVVLGGSSLTIVRGLRGRLPPSVARSLVVANVCIAAGTLVLSAGGLLNSVVDEMDGFAMSLVVGVTLLFAGFLSAPRSAPAARRATGLRAVPDSGQPAAAGSMSRRSSLPPGPRGSSSTTDTEVGHL